MKIHHLGLVVTNLDEALEALNIDRSQVVETVYDSNQKNNLHFVFLEQNNMWLELVEPMAQDASTYNFAKKHTLGLHHLGIENQNLEKMEELYTQRTGNFVLGRYQISVKSFGGKIRTLFIAVKGLIVEFVKSDE